MDIFTAFLDLVPVGLFLAASILLQRALYNKMSKGAFALFAAGTIVVFVAGAMKAIHKILYYTAGLNIYSLAKGFFPLETLGFVLAAIGLIATICHKQGEGKTYVVAVPAMLAAVLIDFSTVADDSNKATMIFVALMCLGVAVMYGILAYFAVKVKSIVSLILLIVAFICTLGMGYLATKNNLDDLYKEIVNSVGQACFLAAAIILNHKGLSNIDAFKGLAKE